MNLHNFPVPPKEYNTLMRAIPVGLTQLIKCHLKFSEGNSIYPALRLGGIHILDWKCNNKHICNLSISKYSDVDESCSCCGFVEETAARLFYDCGVTNYGLT